MADSTRIKDCILPGIEAFSIYAILQAIVSATLLAIRYTGLILSPHKLYRTPFLWLFTIIFGYSDETIPFVTNRYLGPEFKNFLPIFSDLILVSLSLCLAAAFLAALLLWFVLKLKKVNMPPHKIRIFFLAMTASLLITLNLPMWIWKPVRIHPFSVHGGMLICIFLPTFLFLWRRLFAFSSSRSFRSGSQSRFISTFVLLLLISVPCLAFGLKSFELPAADFSTARSTVIGNTRRNPNIILISIDSLRADHLGCYGYSAPTSPNIDLLAKDGILFSNGYAATSWTTPSHAAILTSVSPEGLGMKSEWNRLNDSQVSLAEVLKKSGYETAAFVSGPTLNSEYGLSQGFSLYDDFTVPFSHRYSGLHDAHQSITSPKLTSLVQHWIDTHASKRFFLFAHFWDVHYDYNPPPPYDRQFDPDYRGSVTGKMNDLKKLAINGDKRDFEHVRALYDGEIAYTDKHIGDIFQTLKDLKLYDNALIVLTADHGDEFHEHGFVGHDRTLYDEVLRVPVIFKLPINSGFPAKMSVEEAIRHVDLMPTILDYTGIQPPPQAQGVSLLREMHGNRSSHDTFIFTTLRHKIAAIQSNHYKLIFNFDNVSREFYDLRNDPHEKANLESQPDLQNKIASYAILLRDWLNGQVEIYDHSRESSAVQEIEISESMKEELKSLGYIQQ